MSCATIISYILVFFIRTSVANDDVLPLLVQIGSAENSGIKFKLTDTGLAYVREVAMRALSRELSNLQLNQRIGATLPRNLGTITVTRMQVKEYWQPESYDLTLLPPDRIQWSMKGMGVRATGVFDSELRIPTFVVPIKSTGGWDALIDYMDFDIIIQISKERSGHARLHTIDCSTQVHGFDLQLLNSGVLLQTAISFVKGIIAGEVKPIIADQICQRVENIVNDKVNLLLRTMPIKIPLDESSIESLLPKTPIRPIRGKRQIGGLDINELDLEQHTNKIRNKNILLDMSLDKTPLMSHEGYILTEHSGEMSWLGRGNTPFHPAAMSDVRPIGRRMLQLYVSDYVANSLLFALHRKGILDFSIKADSSDKLKELLATTCNSFCLGDLLYPLADEYPDHLIDIRLATDKMPTVIFLNESAAVGMSARMNMFVRDPDSQKSTKVLDASVSLTAHIGLSFSDSGQSIIGQMQIDRLDLNLGDSILEDVDQYLLDDLADVMKEFLGSTADAMLQEGIDIPKMDAVELRRPKLTLMQHTLLIDSYFKLNETFVQTLIERYLPTLIEDL